MPTDAQELPSPDLNSSKEAKAVDIQSPEQTRENLYAGVLYREATSLLGKYLPEALPQEPTKIFFDIQPQHLGKFKGKHYITIDSLVFGQAYQKRINEMLRRSKELRDRYERENEEWLRLLKENASKGVYDEDLESKVFSTDQEPEIEIELEDWEEPERLLKGRDQYSVDTWRRIYTLMHELIHQRQAELNPQAISELSSPELENIDLENISKNDLKGLLTQAHKAQNRTTDQNSIFYPIIEGTAVVGSFYVMGRLLADLQKAGQNDVAGKIKQERNRTVRHELVDIERGNRAGKVDPYNLNYVEGVSIIRKLYKRFGIENTPKILVSVDLKACQGISKGSSEYQLIMEDPSLLPGLNKNPLVGSSIK